MLFQKRNGELYGVFKYKDIYMNVKNNPTDKYLKLSEFLYLCSAMHVPVSIKLLEAYEMHGVIRPSYRLHIPEDYAKARFKYRHSTVDERLRIESLPEWNDIRDFLDDLIQNYSDERALLEGHPLDWAYNTGKTY